MDIPTDLKYITPYIQRGQELLARDPIMAYYAQYYAAKQAIARGPRTKETNEYLSHLLDALETQKQAIGANEAITNDLVGYAHVENFALKIFINADNEDRAGKASKKTAKTFLAASIFLELLKTFGDIDPEVEAKIKYSKWKAADIMKALREGRVPTPGPPGGITDDNNDNNTAIVQEQEPQDMETSSSSNATEKAPSTLQFDKDTLPAISDFPDPPLTSVDSTNIVPAVSTPQQPSYSSQPVQPPTTSSFTSSSNAQVQPQPQQAASSNMPSTVFQVSPSSIAKAQKYCKWAISAMDYEDIENARTQLLSALNEIGYNKDNNFGL